MQRQRRLAGGSVLIVAILGGAGACSAGETGGDAAAGPVVRDSAGVRIVEIPAGPVDTVQAEAPVLTIGEEGDPRYEFDGVRLVAGLEDGRIAVVDYSANAVRYYGADGAHLADVGRAGEGPGEFGFISTAQLIQGDTIVVNDTRIRRISYMAPDMSFVRSVSYVSEMGEMNEGAEMCVFPGWSGMITDGGVRHVLRSWGCVFATGTEGLNWFRHAMRLWDPLGDTDVPVFEMAFMQNWERPDEESVRRFSTPRFPFVAYPFVWEGPVAVTHPMEHTLSVWALHYDVPGMTGQHWRVYDGDGNRLRVVAFPPGFELQSVRHGRSYGIHEDDLGIQRPAVYEVPR